MTLCDFYIHDYEVFDDFNKIKTILEDKLTSYGFIKHESKSGWVTWKSDTISIPEWGIHRDHTLESCIPISHKTKVCVRCGKIVSNYDTKYAIQDLLEIIRIKTNEYNKTQKAKSILGESK